jgi:hypothetical protein
LTKPKNYDEYEIGEKAFAADTIEPVVKGLASNCPQSPLAIFPHRDRER